MDATNTIVQWYSPSTESNAILEGAGSLANFARRCAEPSDGGGGEDHSRR